MDNGIALIAIILLGVLCGICPIYLNIYNFVGLFREHEKKRKRNVVWIATLLVGAFDVVMYLTLFEVLVEAPWDRQIIDLCIHQPIWTGAWGAIAIVVIVGFIGAAILAGNNVNKIPPLVTVLCISSIYLVLALSAVFCIQVTTELHFLPCWLYPANLLCIAINLIREKIKEWNSEETHDPELYGKNLFIKGMNEKLRDTDKWSIYALAMMIPLLGIILIILVLFGQEPDILIKAWTETADWKLSQRIGPPNYLDARGHYLCTVAAGGHKKLVKPVRMGERRGHRILVNRQLMIANAFENVLEEKTPRLHRVIRDFYDKYGLPLAYFIRNSKIACDVTYIIMKPLEWIFVTVIYLVDAKPENRIAVQYMPREKGEVQPCL